MKVLSKITIKQKIFWGYLILILIPLITITSIYYTSSVNIMENKAEQQLGLAGEAINEQYNTFFRDIDAISRDITGNDFVQETMGRAEHSVIGEPYTSVRLQNEMETYFTGICVRKPGIDSILIHGDNTLNYCFSLGYSWNKEYHAGQEEWYQEVLKADGHWVLTGIRSEKQLIQLGAAPPQVVTFARLVKDMITFKPLGVLQININTSYLFQLGLDSANNDGYISIYDSQNHLVFSNRDDNNKKVLVIETVSDVTGWKTVYYAPKDELLKEIRDMRTFMWMVTGILLLVGIVFAQLISHSIVNPLKKLHVQMKQVAAGNFTVSLEYAIQDEMGELIKEFNQMTEKVHTLVQQIHEKEEQRRKTEMDALQARINPHFIYNTLNGIRLTAMMHKEDEIAKQLTDFVYLLKAASYYDNGVSTIDKDLQIMEAYYALMKYRYDNFTLTVYGAEEVKEYQIVPFILQPIVENAIFHGIAALNRPGKIEISFRKEEGKLIAEIMDDGVGMDEKKLQELTAGQPDTGNNFNHIGMQNVYDRLHLYFGEEASMTIESKEGFGTRVILKWPARKRNLDL